MIELIYVDEQKDQRNKVVRAAVRSEFFEKNQVMAIEPSNSLDETIEKILEHNFKVLIVDYKLSEFNPDVQFDGVELVRKFQERFYKFPCFITTAFAPEAAQDKYDINLIFSKRDFLDTGEEYHSDLPFFQRVSVKIQEYDEMKTRMQDRILELQKKMKVQELSSRETQELIDLDNQLEKSLGAEYSTEGHLKQQAIEPFGKLLGRANELIKKIETELGENSKIS